MTTHVTPPDLSAQSLWLDAFVRHLEGALLDRPPRPRPAALPDARPPLWAAALRRLRRD